MTKTTSAVVITIIIVIALMYLQPVKSRAETHSIRPMRQIGSLIGSGNTVLAEIWYYRAPRTTSDEESHGGIIDLHDIGAYMFTSPYSYFNKTLVVAVDLAHGESDRYLDDIIGNITFVEWKVINVSITSDILLHVDVLIIGQPTTSFTYSEMNAIRNWLNSGNKVLWIAGDSDYGIGNQSQQICNDLLDFLGVKLRLESVAVFDSYHNAGMKYRVLAHVTPDRISWLHTDIISQGVIKPILMHSSAPIIWVDEQGNYHDPVRETYSGLIRILWSYNTAYVYDFNPPDPFVYDTPLYGEGTGGHTFVMAAAEYYSDKNSMVIVSGQPPYGDYIPLFAWEYHSVQLDGPQFIKNMLLWFSYTIIEGPKIETPIITTEITTTTTAQITTTTQPQTTTTLTTTTSPHTTTTAPPQTTTTTTIPPATTALPTPWSLSTTTVWTEGSSLNIIGSGQLLLVLAVGAIVGGGVFALFLVRGRRGSVSSEVVGGMRSAGNPDNPSGDESGGFFGVGGSVHNSDEVSLGNVRLCLGERLDGLIGGFGCVEGYSPREVDLRPGIAPEGFEGRWECCLLGCGGWGCAYLCRNEGREAVFKVPRGFEGIFEGGFVPTVHVKLLERIRGEAEVLRGLKHPNVLRLLGVSRSAPVLAYEFAEGGSLDWQLSRGWSPSVRDVLLVGIQVGDALRYIHSRGLIHGDIKPGNVFIKGGVAKVGDFSSMIRLVTMSSRLSRLSYTPGFRSPEQVFADLRRKVREFGLESRIDTYLLGNLLLYLLTGRSVDGEEAVGSNEVEKATETIEDPELREVIKEALNPDPLQRPSTEEIVKKLLKIWVSKYGKL